jgi:phosphoribosylaminoimidazole-succinocarboxamide synthase
MEPIQSTNLQINGFEVRRYEGKVRDVYSINERVLAIVATDRISAFDVILPRAIPFKGQVLNQLAATFLSETNHICENHFVSMPHPNVMFGIACEPYPVEFVVRGYLCGHAWREYSSGKREICGVRLPDGLREAERLPEPILTPTTKSHIGHDVDISEAEIIKSALIPADEFHLIKHHALQLFAFGQARAAERGLILADTKYEFGSRGFSIYLIDEIHTPDSSRYLIADGYEDRLREGLPQVQLSKEFVREWLMSEGFRGQEGQVMPEMTDERVDEISRKYITLYEQLLGTPFIPHTPQDLHADIQQAVQAGLNRLRDKI